MKKSGIVVISALTSALLAQAAHASCGEKYEAYVAQLEPKVEEQRVINHRSYQVEMAGITLGSLGATTTLAALPPLGGAGFSVSIAGGATGLAAGRLLAEASFGADRLDEFQASLRDAKFSLQALREAYIGSGEAVYQMTNRISSRVYRPDLSPALVAKTLTELDSENAICGEDASVDSSNAIADKLVARLK